MNDNAVEVLKHIADKLDVPVQQLWHGLVAYAPFTFYTWIVVVTLFVIALLCVFVFVYMGKIREEYFGCAVFAFFVALVSGIFSLADMSSALAARYAPEAWATQYVIRSLRR